MHKTKIDSILSFLKDKKILITTHHPIDLDGFVSSIALKFLFENYFKHQEIVINFPKFSKSLNNFISKFMERFPNFPLSYLKNADINNFDVLIILDTNNLDQVKILENKQKQDLKIPYIFIDHHYYLNKNYSGNLKSFNIISDQYSSTAEIILDLFRNFDLTITIPYKLLLIAAIVKDSGFFRYGNNQTIFNISTLLDKNIAFQDILRLLESDLENSEKIAKIKGLQRVELMRIGRWLVGISRVSSFSASVASMLISVGCDISIVISEKKKRTIITTRASKKICQETGLHLGKILTEIGEINAGGHDGAASLNCNMDVEIILNKVLKEIKKVLFFLSS